MIEKCPECQKEMESSIWTEDVLVLHCEPCKRRYYYSKKLKRIMDNEDIHKLRQGWE